MRALTCVWAGAAVLLAAWTANAIAAAPSGTTLAVVQSANVEGETGKKILEAEAPVFAGDRIVTGPVGEAQILFRDNTKLVVGPNSSMVIDAFVFDDANTARQISINAAKGVFRFFTGVSRKDAYTITTPTATIGVRGTEFDISIEKEGTTRVANFEGLTRICRRGSSDPDSCVESKDPCTLSVVRPTESKAVSLSNKDIEFRNRQLKYYFNYIRNQSGLRSDFQVDLAQCKFAEVIPDISSPPVTPGVITPPVIPPIPMPGGVSAPPFSSPQLPPAVDRHDPPGRPEYNHGPEIR